MEADEGGGGEAGGQGQGGGGAGAQGAGGGGGGDPGAHLVLPYPETEPPSTDVEGRSPQGKRAREEDEEAGQERGKQGRGEERVAGEAEGAPRPASPSEEPTPTDWDSESPPPRQYAPPPVQRGPRTVAGWTEGEVAGLACYVKLVGKTRGRRDKRGPRPFSDLVSRAESPRERGPDMGEGRWRRMLGAALAGVRLDCPQEKGEEAQGSDAARAIAAGGAVRWRRVGRGRSRNGKR